MCACDAGSRALGRWPSTVRRQRGAGGRRSRPAGRAAKRQSPCAASPRRGRDPRANFLPAHQRQCHHRQCHQQQQHDHHQYRSVLSSPPSPVQEPPSGLPVVIMKAARPLRAHCATGRRALPRDPRTAGIRRTSHLPGGANPRPRRRETRQAAHATAWPACKCTNERTVHWRLRHTENHSAPIPRCSWRPDESARNHTTGKAETSPWSVIAVTPRLYSTR